MQHICQCFHEVCTLSHLLDDGSRAGCSGVCRRCQVRSNRRPLRRRTAPLPAQGGTCRRQLIGVGG